MAAAGLRVSGCDISEEMLGYADISDSVKAVEWVKLDPAWRALPFESAIFDAVVAASVLEYVDSPCLVLHECARVLRPGGALLFTVPDPAHPVRWLESVARAVIRIPLIRAVVGGRPIPELPGDLMPTAPGWLVARYGRAGRAYVSQPTELQGRALTTASVHRSAADQRRGNLVTGPAEADIAAEWRGGATRYASGSQV
jgi:SAM-dependent methyltransferase